MILEYPTSLPPAEARRRVDRLADNLTRKYGFAKTWSGDRLFMTGKISIVKLQALAVFPPGMVRLDVSDPGLLWRGRAKALIDEQMRTYLAPNAVV
jgi:Putative polyhydroxyalkanoic acid system protein (PHA_gran_rgn)